MVLLTCKMRNLMFAREVLTLKNNKYAVLSMDKTQMKKDTMCFMTMSL